MQINKVPFNFGFQVYKRAWQTTKPFWAKWFFVGLIIMSVAMVLSLVPTIGDLLSGLLTSVFWINIFICAYYQKTYGYFRIKQIFTLFYEDHLLNKVLPYVVAAGIISVFEPLGKELAEQSGVRTYYWFALVLGGLLGLLIWWSSELILFRNLSFKESVRVNCLGIAKNWFALLLMFLIPLIIFVLLYLPVPFSKWYSGNSKLNNELVERLIHVLPNISVVVVCVLVVIFLPTLLFLQYEVFSAIFGTPQKGDLREKEPSLDS